MASYNKFNQFATDVCQKVHNIGSDTINCGLSNTAPVATNTVWANITEIAAGNGYSAGGASAGVTGAGSSGTFTATGTNITWTASVGNIGPFEYIVLYNTTPTSPLKPLIAWWDYGSALTLNGTNGDSLTVKFNGGASSGTIFTLA